MINNDINQRLIQNNDDNFNISYDLCCLFSCVYILYFLISVPFIFLDVIFAIGSYRCDTETKPLINIISWLLVNGIFGYIGLIIIILLRNKIYQKEICFYKSIYISGYVINGFLIIWSILGLTTFIKSYYGNEICDKTLYTYLTIRMILAPLIGVFKFLEVHYSKNSS
jgi:hypothetical protein